ATAIVFLLLAGLALLYSIYGSDGASRQHQTEGPPTAQPANPSKEKNAVVAGKKQLTPVEHMEVTWQPAEVTQGNKTYNALTFRVINKFDSNIKDVEIAIYTSYPYPQLDESTFLTNTAKCTLLPAVALAEWHIECEYIGVDGVIGFSFSSDLNQTLPSGE